MKTTLLILTLIFPIFFAGCDFGTNTDNVSIRIKNTAEFYNFNAFYPARKTKKVIAYMEETLKEDRLFKSEMVIKDSEVLIADGTRFYLKSKPGSINIDFTKQKNSFENYKRMEKLCLGLKKVISE